MKLGLISDIHGNLEHFEQALRLLEHHHVDGILCTGDLVYGASQPDAVIERIQQLNIPTTLGNHDEDTGDEMLTPQSKAFLAQLPLIKRFTFEGKTLLLTHATPWNNSIHIFSQSSLPLFRRVIDEAHADCIVFGHTHEPMKAQIDDVWLFNPGSVYRNRFEDTQSCAVLSLPNFEYVVYDLERGERMRIPFLRKVWKSPHLSRNWA
jgi:putative phosphoesterase